jgi:hypothetical protein
VRAGQSPPPTAVSLSRQDHYQFQFGGLAHLAPSRSTRRLAHTPCRDIFPLGHFPVFYLCFLFLPPIPSVVAFPFSSLVTLTQWPVIRSTTRGPVLQHPTPSAQEHRPKEKKKVTLEIPSVGQEGNAYCSSNIINNTTQREKDERRGERPHPPEIQRPPTCARIRQCRRPFLNSILSFSSSTLPSRLSVYCIKRNKSGYLAAFARLKRILAPRERSRESTW